MKVVILCGGKGTRSYPFTEHYPKVMMPIAGTPILVHLMRIFAAQGFNDFILAAGHRMEILTDYFSGRRSEWNIDIADTGPESDTGDRVKRCLDRIGDDTFLVTYGDGLGNVDLHNLIRFHRSHGALATVTTVPLRCQYGTLVFDERGHVETFVEKPVIESCWINAGFFVFQKDAFSGRSGGNLETGLLSALAARRELFAYRHRGFWKSMDTSKDLQELERIHNGHGTAAPWAVLTAAAAQ